MYDKRSAEILFQQADRLGLSPKWLTDYGLIEVVFEGKFHYLFYSNTTLNTQLASYLARNKHLTRMILAEHSFPNIPFSLPETKGEIAAFLKQFGTIIAKPTMGSHSQGVFLMTSMKDLKKCNFHEYLFEQYIPGREYRYLVLKGEVIAVHEKLYDIPINNPDMVHRISYEEKEWDEALVELAVNITDVLELAYSCVDFMIDTSGKAYVLEVNSSPGLWRFHYPSQGPVVNVAEKVLKEMMISWE